MGACWLRLCRFLFVVVVCVALPPCYLLFVVWYKCWLMAARWWLLFACCCALCVVCGVSRVGCCVTLTVAVAWCVCCVMFVVGCRLSSVVCAFVV